MSQFHPSGARVMPSCAALPLLSSRAPAASLVERGGTGRRAKLRGHVTEHLDREAAARLERYLNREIVRVDAEQGATVR